MSGARRQGLQQSKNDDKEVIVAKHNRSSNMPISDDDFTEEELDLIYGIDRNGVPGEDTEKHNAKGGNSRET